MCGCMNGMKKRKNRMSGLKTGGLVNIVTNEALPVALGYLAADLLTKNLSFLSSNPTVGNAVKIGAGVLLAGQGGGMMAGLGVGIAANGVVSFAKPVFNLSGVGLLPPGMPSRYLSGIPNAEMQEGGVTVKF